MYKPIGIQSAEKDTIFAQAFAFGRSNMYIFLKYADYNKNEKTIGLTIFFYYLRIWYELKAKLAG